MTVILGLLAALGWGITDLLARFSGRSIGTYRAMFFVQVPGLAAMTVWLVFDRADLARAVAQAPWQAWAAGLAAAPLVLIASTALFRALAIGRLGVVSPVTASYGAVTAALAALAGEPLGVVTIAGIATTVAGVALASTPARRGAGTQTAEQRSLRGVGWALLASAGYGLGSFVQGRYAVPALGYIVPMWLYYAMGVVIMAALARPVRQSLTLPPPRAWPVVFGTGAFSVAAYTAFAAGLATGRIAEVTVLSTLSSGVAALLGRVVLREELARHQWAGVAAIVTGIALINAGN